MVEVDGDVWTVPGERMKAGREHRVPLSPRALAILDEAREYTDGVRAGVPVASRAGHERFHAVEAGSRKTASRARRTGFRSAFRDWASERTSTAHAVMEAALAHTIRTRRKRPTRAVGPTRQAAGAHGRMGALRRRLAGGGFTWPDKLLLGSGGKFLISLGKKNSC